MENNPKKERKQVMCKVCGDFKSAANISRHVKDCKGKHFGMTKEELIKVVSGESDIIHKDIEELKVINESLKAEKETLMAQVAQLLDENLQLKKQNHEFRELIDNYRIKHKHKKIKISKENVEKGIADAPSLSESSKTMYLGIWKRYVHFAESNNLEPLLKSTANSYISHLCKVNYLSENNVKMRSVLQSVFRKFLNEKTTLEDIAETEPRYSKFFLGESQLNEILEKVKVKDYECYVMLRIQASAGLRINSVINLQKQHLLFDSKGGNQIFITDSKVKKRSKDLKSTTLDDETLNIFKHFLQYRRDPFGESPDEYVFRRGCKSQVKRIRTLTVGNRIRRNLDFKKTNGERFKVGTHDIRRSKAYDTYQKEDRLLSAVQEQLGHSNKYVSNNHYVFKPDRKDYNYIDHIDLEDVEKNNVQGYLRFSIAKNQKQSDLMKSSLSAALLEKDLQFEDDLIIVDQPDLTLSKEDIQRLDAKSLKALEEFKRKSRIMEYGPYEVFKKNDTVGYAVRTTDKVSENTIICEYSGILYHWQNPNHNPEGDSNFVIVKYKDADDEFVIDPSISCNLARFLNGINNTKRNSRKENVYSIRFQNNGFVRILLVTKRTVEKGEELQYDYNAGSYEYPTGHFE
jgi:integrase